MTEHELHDTDDEGELPVRFLDAARECHEPAQGIPREAMWRAIERARQQVQQPAGVPARQLYVGRRLWQLAAAAAVLLAVGYSAGRRATQGSKVSGALATTKAVNEPPRSNAYDVATTEHFARAEVVLMQFRADAERAQRDTAVATWARQLLSDTRLLLDSPAADNATRRSLLEDLELILVQIARTSQGHDSENLKMTSDALRDSGLLDKLRAVVPAGTGPRT